MQRDIWIHQHPLDCGNKSLKFLVADWETLPGFGIGAQIAGMTGLLAIALNENRVLVTNYYNRADHDGCKGTINALFDESSLTNIKQQLSETTSSWLIFF